MLGLCVLAIAVSIATLVTPVAVPIMWNKIEGRLREGAKPIAPGPVSEMNTQEHQPTMQVRPTPAAVVDPGKVRIGGESPSFGPVR
jgi:hypothetical protein